MQISTESQSQLCSAICQLIEQLWNAKAEICDMIVVNWNFEIQMLQFKFQNSIEQIWYSQKWDRCKIIYTFTLIIIPLRSSILITYRTMKWFVCKDCHEKMLKTGNDKKFSIDFL